MAHTYVNNDAGDYETIEIKQGRYQPAANRKKREQQGAFSNVYVESSTDVYEESIKTTPTPKTVHSSETVDTQSGKKCPRFFFSKPNTSNWIVVLVCAVGILAALGLVFGILNFTGKQNLDEATDHTPQTTGQTTLNTTESETTKSPLGTFPNPARSCIQLRDAGFKDGIYVIQPSLKSFEVYCDMVAAGGGWILAATINDNDLSLEESYSDLWFVTSSNNNDNIIDYQNWMNTNTFGTFPTCTRSDFKSPAYFEYQGKDVMLRHVLNQTPLENSREQSFLQYQTENGFMQLYGGNMHKMFISRYPVKPKNVFYPDVNSILDRLEKKSSEIISLIKDFYFYNYGSHSYLMDDTHLFGGNYGMEVRLYARPRCAYPSEYYTDCSLNDYVYYDLDATCGIGNIMYSSRKMHPFFALFGIGNFDHCFDYMNLDLYSQRPVTDSVFLYEGNHTINNFFLHFQSQCRNGTSYASLCDVWFYVINPEVWKSSGTPIIRLYNPVGNSYSFDWRVDKAVSNILYGYTMISRRNGVLITETEIKAATYKILEIITETDFCPDCFYGDDVLSVPVQFSIGNDSVINSMLPPSVKPLPTGFIQFRAYGRTGSVYAMCPAVKVKDWRSEFVCIGGMKNPDSPYLDDCNDFTNWNGYQGTLLNETIPVDYAHSLRDLDSTIMIFYR